MYTKGKYFHGQCFICSESDCDLAEVGLSTSFSKKTKNDINVEVCKSCREYIDTAACLEYSSLISITAKKIKNFMSIVSSSEKVRIKERLVVIGDQEQEMFKNHNYIDQAFLSTSGGKRLLSQLLNISPQQLNKYVQGHHYTVSRHTVKRLHLLFSLVIKEELEFWQKKYFQIKNVFTNKSKKDFKFIDNYIEKPISTSQPSHFYCNLMVQYKGENLIAFIAKDIAPQHNLDDKDILCMIRPIRFKDSKKVIAILGRNEIQFYTVQNLPGDDLLVKLTNSQELNYINKTIKEIKERLYIPKLEVSNDQVRARIC